MQAPDYETLFDVESQVEQGIRQALQEADWRVDGEKIQIALQRDSDELRTPRIDVQLALGAVHNGQFGKDAFGRFWHNAWNATLHCSVFTNRTNNNIYHGELRSRIRKFMQYTMSALGESVMPYHVINKISEAGTTPTVEAEENIDTSELTFSCVISIRNNAWPAVKP